MAGVGPDKCDCETDSSICMVLSIYIQTVSKSKTLNKICSQRDHKQLGSGR
jgi:hypothetical protein